MLELLLYCHLFAKLRFAGEIAVVTDAASRLVMELVARTKARTARWPAPGAYGRNARVPVLAFCTPGDLIQALDRLDAYVVAAA